SVKVAPRRDELVALQNPRSLFSNTPSFFAMCDIRQTILELKKMNTDIEEINERSSNDTQAQSHLHHSVLYPALLRQGIDHPTNVLPDPTSLKDPNAILTAMKMCQIIYYSQYNQLMQALRNRQMQRQRQKEQVDNHENKYREENLCM
ncbi:unnamed protein product, partial [Meganyctiphanes norvegica]